MIQKLPSMLRIVVFAALLFLLPFSCKKYDLSEQPIIGLEQAKQQFFPSAMVTEPEIIALVNDLKFNKKFMAELPQFVQKYGSPIWDKTLNSFQQQAYSSGQVSNSERRGEAGTNGSATTGNSGSFFIPLHQPNNTEITSYIVARKLDNELYSYQLYNKNTLAKVKVPSDLTKRHLINIYSVFGYFEKTINQRSTFTINHPALTGESLAQPTMRFVSKAQATVSSSQGNQPKVTSDGKLVLTNKMAIVTEKKCYDYDVVEVSYEDIDGNTHVDEFVIKKEIACPTGGGSPGGGGPGGGSPDDGGYTPNPNNPPSPSAPGYPFYPGTYDPYNPGNPGDGGSGGGYDWWDDGAGDPSHPDYPGNGPNPNEIDDPSLIPWYAMPPNTRYVQGEHVDPYYYPGMNEGYPWLWWEDDAFLNTLSFAPDDGIAAQWRQLNAAEKQLALYYPFSAIMIGRNKAIAKAVTIEKFGDNGLNDKSDAFRHAFFNAMNERDCGQSPYGESIAKLFADAHETTTPDLLILEKRMDLFNNDIGRSIGSNVYWYTNNADVASFVMTRLNLGHLFYLKPTLTPDQDPTFSGAYNQTGVWDPTLATHGITGATKLTPTNQ